MADVAIAPQVREKLRSGNGVRAGIDAKARTWTSPTTHITFKLRPVSIGLLDRIRSDRTGKPIVPKVKVNYGGETGWEYNPNDPVYVEEYAAWQAQINARVAAFVFSTGVDIEVPDDFKTQSGAWADGITDAEYRYYYVTSQIAANELDALTNAILGQNTPTEDAIADVAASFPRDGER